MASLWSVNDASTSLMMQQFYKQLATGKMTKAEALQIVQQQFITGKLTAKDAPVDRPPSFPKAVRKLARALMAIFPILSTGHPSFSLATAYRLTSPESA